MCIPELAYSDMHALRGKFELVDQSQRQLDSHCSLPQMSSEEPVYRVADATEDDLLKTNPSAPARQCKMTPPVAKYRDLSQAQGEAAVLAGQSLRVLGIAGTGKTHIMSRLVDRLHESGKVVHVICKTHTASTRAGGCTADHDVRKCVLRVLCPADVMWIDEISQLDAGLWAQLNKLSVTGLRFLLSGYFNQFGPLASSFRGTKVADGALEKSVLLHTLCQGNRVVLTQCQRADQQLVDVYSSLIPGGCRYERQLHKVVAEAREVFGQADYECNLCISHRNSMALNKQRNLKIRPTKSFFVKATPKKGQLCQPQDMWLWLGIEMLGCCRAERKGVRNPCLYVATKITTEHVFLKDIKLTHAELEWLRLPHTPKRTPPARVRSLKAGWRCAIASRRGSRIAISLWA